ncbi:response regulator [bacterium]|nr:MAG: response regulator [bacterium]
MAKILLVEDDVNLREIYSARFAAESYQVITASDGEEALATAVREKPDLIVLDVMMPKISGFDVLDILRSTPETKTTKVIMMTALSQDSDRQRGEALGANKYLIKSQVTLEDVVNAVKSQLGGTAATPATTPAAPAAAPTAVTAAPSLSATPEAPVITPAAAPAPVAPTPAPTAAPQPAEPSAQ